ncbi:helix-turn-helix transcriptional regulator [Streptomyces griseoviridis]|uniref:helix-turn-helix transcriptional regulator n=1 Tax=Streptomyces griseoviridis TaxID=45398 RepID=UPI0034100C0F
MLTEASRQQAAAAEISRLRGEVEEFAEFLGEPAERFLNPDFLSYVTGIDPPELVADLLAGRVLPQVEPDGKDALEKFQKDLFQCRLQFLRRTRLMPDGKTCSLRDVAAATGISYQHVSNLINGKRAANAAHSHRIEDFFDRISQQRTPPSRIPAGFCFRNDGVALINHLAVMVSADLPSLTLKVLARDLGTEEISLRATGGEVSLMQLLPTLTRLRDEKTGRRPGRG